MMKVSAPDGGARQKRRSFAYTRAGSRPLSSNFLGGPGRANPTVLGKTSEPSRQLTIARKNNSALTQASHRPGTFSPGLRSWGGPRSHATPGRDQGPHP